MPSYRRDELPSILSNHDLGLFTSTVEGWGVSLQEMLESGLPVRATDAGATRELAAYFPLQLGPFPPSRAVIGGLDDIAGNGYLQTFNWDRIISDYEQQLSHTLGTTDGPAR